MYIVVLLKKKKLLKYLFTQNHSFFPGHLSECLIKVRVQSREKAHTVSSPRLPALVVQSPAGSDVALSPPKYSTGKLVIGPVSVQTLLRAVDYRLALGALVCLH